MKNYAKLYILLIPIFLTLGGCSNNTSTMQPIKILIGGGPGTEFCLLEIKTDGTLEATSCSVKNRDLYNEDIIDEVFENKKIKLSRQERKVISNLVTSLENSKTDDGSDKAYLDFNEVSAIVNNKNYWSLYTSDYKTDKDNKDINKDLLNLTYKMIELSPIKVGGEYNTIKTPRDK